LGTFEGEIKMIDKSFVRPIKKQINIAERSRINSLQNRADLLLKLRKNYSDIILSLPMNSPRIIVRTPKDLVDVFEKQQLIWAVENARKDLLVVESLLTETQEEYRKLSREIM
jgi:hypothetical protein